MGGYGIPKDYHNQPIKNLSDGLKIRLVFCEIALQKPHLILLDEPTNSADMEMIDSMSEAIEAFNGGVVVISPPVPGAESDASLLETISRQGTNETLSF